MNIGGDNMKIYITIDLKERKCNDIYIPDRDLPEFVNICKRHDLDFDSDWIYLTKLTPEEIKFLEQEFYIT